MDKVIALIIGAVCGVGQFLLMRYTLKPLAEGKSPQIGLGMLLRLPIPIILLLGCALIDSALLPFAGGALCLSMVVAAVVNHLITLKKKE